MQLVAVTYMGRSSILDISFACQRNRRNPQRSSHWLRLPYHKFCRLLPSSTSTRSWCSIALVIGAAAMHIFISHMAAAAAAAAEYTRDDRPWEKKNVCVLFGFYKNRRNQLACMPGYLFTVLLPPPSIAATLWGCLLVPRSVFFFLLLWKTELQRRCHIGVQYLFPRHFQKHVIEQGVYICASLFETSETDVWCASILNWFEKSEPLAH